MRESRATWGIDKARELYDQDKSYGEIAKTCFVSRGAVAGYAWRHWPKRAIDQERFCAKFRPQMKPKAPKEEAKPVLITSETTLPPLSSLTFLDET